MRPQPPPHEGLGQSHEGEWSREGGHTSVTRLRRAEGLPSPSCSFSEEKETRSGVFCPKTEEAGIGPGFWWECSVWTPAQSWETALISLAQCHPLWPHRGTAGLPCC